MVVAEQSGQRVFNIEVEHTGPYNPGLASTLGKGTGFTLQLLQDLSMGLDSTTEVLNTAKTATIITFIVLWVSLVK